MFENIISNFHFLRSQYLYLFIILVLILILVKLYKIIKNYLLANSPNKNINNNWSKIINPDILNYLYISPNKNNNINSKNIYKNNFLINNILLIMITSLIILALAGPSWLKKNIPLYQNEDSWLILLNLSNSMEETDVTPSRLQRAKYKITDFLKYLKDEQIGLITFTDKAYEIIPLTTDKATIEHILPSLIPIIMPIGGSDVDSALKKARELINNLNLKSSNILLLTDNKANSQSILTATKLSKQNIAIYSINFNKQIDLSNTSLKELSNLSNGLYQNYTNNDLDLQNILQHSNYRYQQIYQKDKDSQKTVIWQDMGPYLLFLIMPLLLILIYINNINILYILLILVSYSTLCTLDSLNNKLYASNVLDNIIYNEQQLSAKKLLENNNNNIEKINPENFYDNNWRASAYYKNKNYSKAEELLKDSLKNNPTNIYNYANTLAKQGKIDQALENYNKVLEKNPEYKDALYNKKLLEDYQKNQKDNKNQNNSQNNKQQDQEESDNNTNQTDKNKQSKPDNKNYKNKQDQTNTDNNNLEELEKNQKTDLNQKQEQKQKQDLNKKDTDKDQNQTQNNNTDSDLRQKTSNKELEKWLNKIPDNPAIYLKNQLQYEYWKEQQNTN